MRLFIKISQDSSIQFTEELKSKFGLIIIDEYSLLSSHESINNERNMQKHGWIIFLIALIFFLGLNALLFKWQELDYLIQTGFKTGYQLLTALPYTFVLSLLLAAFSSIIIFLIKSRLPLWYNQNELFNKPFNHITELEVEDKQLPDFEKYLTEIYPSIELVYPGNVEV